jgi:hypothetical protein
MLQPSRAKEVTQQPDGALKGSGTSMAAAAWQRQLGGGHFAAAAVAVAATAVATATPAKLPFPTAAVAGGDKDTGGMMAGTQTTINN